MTDSDTKLARGAVRAFPVMGKVEGRTCLALIRKIRKSALKRIANGERDAQTIAAQVETELLQDNEVGSILVIIGIAILSGVIQWIVKQLLDNWWNREPDDA